MAFQQKALVMIGVGMRGEESLHEALPVPDDGIHLRWSFAQDRGFPRHGYYLFRREHIEDKNRCLAGHGFSVEHGAGRQVVDIPGFGFFSSDQPLEITPSGHLSLNNRTSLVFSLPAGDPAFKVSVELRATLKGKLRLRAWQWEFPVHEQIFDPDQHTTEPVILEADTITEVRIDTPTGELLEGVLLELCYFSVRDHLRFRWSPVVFPQPLCLPVAHDDYPCSGRPTDERQARDLARSRVQYGPPQRWTDTHLSELHDLLGQLVSGGDDAPAMHLRHTESVAAEDATDSSPVLNKLSPLEIVLMGTLSPAVAR